MPIDGSMPPYLANSEPMEIEDIPLQVSLLTMEVAELRKAQQRLSVILETLARLVAPPSIEGT